MSTAAGAGAGAGAVTATTVTNLVTVAQLGLIPLPAIADPVKRQPERLNQYVVFGESI